MADVALDTREAKVQASGSSFYAGMRLLPKAEREAMFAIYAFAHAVDDVADEGDDPPPVRLAALDCWRRDMEALYAGAPPPRVQALANVVRRYGLKKEDFLAIIDGMEMDVVEDIRAPELRTLDLYCDRVASAVGRLSVKVFGMEDAAGVTLSYHLGRALQLTNILRDLDKDAETGRLYLPRDYLAEAGIVETEPKAVIAHRSIDTVCRRLAALAHEHYRGADAIFAAHPRGLLQAPRLMGAVYSEILRRMERAGWAPPRERVRIGKARLLFIVLTQSIFG
jgi:phytoene synthase